jgi:predicted naringenin-chalcone synthase
MEHRESHHIIERSEANGSDLRKVAFFLYHFRDYHGHCHRDFESDQQLYQFLAKHETVEEALDTLYNQLILCKDHHRGMSVGIHGMSAPMFDAWIVRKDGFEPTFSREEAEKWLKTHVRE